MILKSTNAGIEHEVIFIFREKEIILALPDGQEIASLTVETMTADLDGEESTKFTKNFYVLFKPIEASMDKNIADVWIERPNQE